MCLTPARRTICEAPPCGACDEAKGHHNMHTNRILNRIIAGALLTGGWAAVMLMSGNLVMAGLGAGTARADDDCGPAAMVNHVCWGPNRWCPGDSLFHLTQNHVYNPVTWDMNVCHTYYHVAFDQGNQGQGIHEGPSPPTATEPSGPRAVSASASRHVLEYVDSRALPWRLAIPGTSEPDKDDDDADHDRHRR